MKTFKKLQTEKVTDLINRRENNNQQLQQNVGKGLRSVNKCLNRITRNIWKLIFIGIILNIVSSYFYPEFDERFPAIYGWFDGWLQLGEFAIKAAFNGIYSLFDGHWSEFWINYNEEFKELWQQFVNWLATL